MKKLGMGKLWMLQGESTPNILDCPKIILKYSKTKYEHIRDIQQSALPS